MLAAPAPMGVKKAEGTCARSAGPKEQAPRYRWGIRSVLAGGGAAHPNSLLRLALQTLQEEPY